MYTDDEEFCEEEGDSSTDQNVRTEDGQEDGNDADDAEDDNVIEVAIFCAIVFRATPILRLTYSGFSNCVGGD